jgi:hypothetical protein
MYVFIYVPVDFFLLEVVGVEPLSLNAAVEAALDALAHPLAGHQVLRERPPRLRPML